MKTKELIKVIESHSKWLKGGPNSAKANLSRANLSWANLSRANLSRANLSRADLSEANLSGADLSKADLSRANLSGANLSEANLSGADLSWANLSRANLSEANLSRADLSEANLSGADLSKADLSEANLSEAKLPPLSILPDGDLVVFKKLRGDKIAELKIPADAKRVNSTGRKCRAEWAEVISVNGNKNETGNALHDGTEYKPGFKVTPDSYNPDFRVECSHGIHFFITREEAEQF